MEQVVRSMRIEEPEGGFLVEMEIGQPGEHQTESSDYVRFRVTLQTDDLFPRLPELKLAALRHVRTMIGSEIQDLERARGRIPDADR